MKPRSKLSWMGKKEKGLLSSRSLRKHRLQRVLARHLLPGGAPVVQLDEAAAVGVDAVLVEPPRHLGRPHRLHQVASHGGELVVDEEVGVGEIAATWLTTSHETSGELLPSTPLPPIPDADDEGGVGLGPSPLQGVAGGHVLQWDPDARLGLDGSDAHLDHGLLHHGALH